MMKFVLVLVLIIIYSLAFADSTDVNYCELSSDQKKKFDKCFDTFLTDKEKETKNKFVKCLKYNSMAEYFDYICSLESMDEAKERHRKCESEIDEDIYTNVPKKDLERCFEEAK